MLLLLARMDRVHTTGISSTIGKECGNSEVKSPDRFRAETMARSWWTRTSSLQHFLLWKFGLFSPGAFRYYPAAQMELGWSASAKSDRFLRKGMLS